MREGTVTNRGSISSIAGAMRWLHRVVLVVLLRRDQPKEERRPLLWRRRMKRGEW